MRNTITIMKKELISFFLSPIAYMVLTAFLIMNGIIFWLIVNVLSSPMSGGDQSGAMGLFFGGTVFFWLFLLFVIPVITMKSFSEEKKNNTIEGLLTVPVTDIEIILGKYLGVYLFYIFLWVPTIIYVLILATNSTLDILPILSGYIGILLVGASYVSIGVLVSLFTGNQIISAIITFTILVILFLAGLIGNVVMSPALKDVFSYMNSWDHMEYFAKGVLNTRYMAYYILIVIFTIFISIQILKSRSWR